MIFWIAIVLLSWAAFALTLLLVGFALWREILPQIAVLLEIAVSDVLLALEDSEAPAVNNVTLTVSESSEPASGTIEAWFKTQQQKARD